YRKEFPKDSLTGDTIYEFRKNNSNLPFVQTAGGDPDAAYERYQAKIQRYQAQQTFQQFASLDQNYRPTYSSQQFGGYAQAMPPQVQVDAQGPFIVQNGQVLRLR